MDSLKLQSRHVSFKMTEKRSGHDQLMELQTSAPQILKSLKPKRSWN